MRIHYAQCWEDPETLMQALEITPQDDVVSIASAGDNSFALLLGNPCSLTVIDSNPAQIYLVELKIKAIQKLDYDDFVEFIGARPCPYRLQLYSYLRPSLSPKAQNYWDRQTKIISEGIIHYGKFEKYFSIFRRFVLPLIHNEKSVRKLLSSPSHESKQIFYDKTWNNRRWRWLFKIFFGKFLLGHLGRRTSYFKHVKIEHIADELLRRTQHGLTKVPIKDNFFIEYILIGQYRDLEKAHPYLRKSNFFFLKKHVGRMQLYCESLEEYLKSVEPRSISKLNLSDIFEYVSDEAFEQMLREILRVCREGAKLAYWTLLVPRHVPSTLAEGIDSNIKLSEELFANNRTFFYGSFGVWSLNTSTVHKTEASEFNVGSFKK